VTFFKRPLPRGVTVFTGATAEHYPTAETWRLDDKLMLHVYDPGGRQIATFLVGTWERVEAGPYSPKP
jgi:hypothetical protein